MKKQAMGWPPLAGTDRPLALPAFLAGRSWMVDQMQSDSSPNYQLLEQHIAKIRKLISGDAGLAVLCEAGTQMRAETGIAPFRHTAGCRHTGGPRSDGQERWEFYIFRTPKTRHKQMAYPCHSLSIREWHASVRKLAGDFVAEWEAELVMKKTDTCERESPIESATGSPVPKVYLTGWAEITDAVGQRNDDTSVKRIKRLADMVGDCPISYGGKTVLVERDKLIEWWNSIESRLEELNNRRRDVEETTKQSHSHGRDGEVVPGIAGSVKKRRQRK